MYILGLSLLLGFQLFRASMYCKFSFDLTLFDLQKYTFGEISPSRIYLKFKWTFLKSKSLN